MQGIFGYLIKYFKIASRFPIESPMEFYNFDYFKDMSRHNLKFEIKRRRDKIIRIDILINFGFTMISIIMGFLRNHLNPISRF